MKVGQLSTEGSIIKVLRIRKKMREKGHSRRSWKKKEA
jgi:hypothetical protein